MKIPIRADAATMRAWAIETGRPVGSRGAISAELHNQYVLAAARLAVAVTPSVMQAAADRNVRRQEDRATND